MDFTKAQSSAIRSIQFAQDQIKIRFQNSPTAYRYTATPEIIQEIHQTAQNAKKDPKNHSIGQLISNLLKNNQLTQQPNNYPFTNTIQVGNTDNPIYAQDFVIKFRSLTYVFNKTQNTKTITITKFETRKDRKPKLIKFTNHNLTNARKIWKNLHHRNTVVETVKYEYHEQ